MREISNILIKKKEKEKIKSINSIKKHIQSHFCNEKMRGKILKGFEEHIVRVFPKVIIVMNKNKMLKRKYIQ
jgi:hypothetical protein